MRIPSRFSGRRSMSISGSTDVTLTADQVSAGILEFTGTLTGNVSVIYPESIDGARISLANKTTGAFTLTVKVSGQTGFVIGSGKRCEAYFDDTDIVRLTADV